MIFAAMGMMFIFYQLQAIILSLMLFAPAHATPADDAQELSARQTTRFSTAYNVERINLPLDHFSTSSSRTRTFPNRYFINDTFYRPGGPVFLFDVGESGVGRSIIQTHLAPGRGYSSAAIELAARFHGLVILWEHRFFGASQYFTPDEYGILGGQEAYQYLTIEQALEDVVYFATHFNSSSPNVAPNLEALKPGNTPWIMIGGSYPGIRSAVLRIRNPDIIYAAWASSAPVQSTDAMGDFYDGLQRVMPRNCTADIHAAVTNIDRILLGQNETQILNMNTQLYLAYHAESETNWTDSTLRVARRAAANLDSAAYMNSWRYLWQSSGLSTITPFCDYIERYNIGTSSMYGNLISFQNSWNGRPTSVGIAATYDNNTVVRAFISALHATRFSPTSLPLDASSSPELIDNISSFAADDPSWAWIRATEFGNWMPTDVTETGYPVSYTHLTLPTKRIV